VPKSGVSGLAKGSKKKGVDSFGNGGNAPQKMTRKEFEKELAKLQIELTRLQAWTVAEGARVIVVFEGRDTAGKGGVISRIMQRCNPRVFKHIALPKPSDREKSQLYIQRYLTHFPAAGEIVMAAMAPPSPAPTTCRRGNIGLVLSRIGRMAASDPWPWQRQPPRPHEPSLPSA